MFVIRILDLLFVYSFVGGVLAVLSVGVRILLMSDDHRLTVWTTAILISGAASGMVACVWAFVDLGRMPKSQGRRSDWKEILWRYPMLTGPAAYYLGEYRPKKRQPANWFARLMKS